MIIEEGMYVRTLKGIAKIIDRKLDPNDYYFQCWVTDRFLCICDDTEYLCDSDILKASYNIIDLIEVGDYVNGYKIDYINLNCESPFLRSNQPYRVDNTLYRTLIEKGKDYNQPLHFYEEDIKSIVTKEQFNSMKYEVDSNE